MKDRELERLREGLKLLSANTWLRYLPEGEIGKLNRKIDRINSRLEEYEDRNNRGVPVDDEDYRLWKEGFFDDVPEYGS